MLICYYQPKHIYCLKSTKQSAGGDQPRSQSRQHPKSHCRHIRSLSPTIDCGGNKACSGLLSLGDAPPTVAGEYCISNFPVGARVDSLEATTEAVSRAVNSFTGQFPLSRSTFSREYTFESGWICPRYRCTLERSETIIASYSQMVANG